MKSRQGKMDFYFDVVRVFLIEWVSMTEGAVFSSQEICLTWATSVLFCLFQRSYSTFMHTFICVRRACAHENRCPQRPEKGAGFPRAGIVGSLEPKLGSYAKTVHTLNHWTISPAAWSVFINTTKAVYFLLLISPCFTFCFLLCIIFASPNSKFIVLLTILVLSHSLHPNFGSVFQIYFSKLTSTSFYQAIQQ